jgi:hypothetical protein
VTRTVSRIRLAGAGTLAGTVLAAGMAVAPASPAMARDGMAGDSPHTPMPTFVRGPAGRYITFDAPGAALETVASGIDDHGRIVGGYVDARSETHGYMRGTAGRYATIDVPGASATDTSVPLSHPGTAALDINDAGQIVGSYSGAGGKARGFILARGTFTTIAVPGAIEMILLGNNNRGQVVGSYLDAGGTQHAFLRGSRGRLTTIEVPRATTTVALDINGGGRSWAPTPPPRGPSAASGSAPTGR